MKTILFLFIILVPNFLFAQFSQQGPKLTGNGGIGTTSQGQSVSVSADGNTAIIGGGGDNVSYGAAWIFTRSGGVWTQQGPKLTGTGNIGSALQGTAVSISADGNTAIIGGYGDNGSVNGPVGAFWIFIRNGGVWSQQGPKLVPSGYTGTPRIGSSVSISGDGNTVIVGGPTDNTNIGAAWVFTRSGGVWTQQGQKLLGTGGVIPSFGSSVSLSADGNTAIIGGSSDINGIYQVGAAWIFVRSGGAWGQQGPKLVGTGNVTHSSQGSSVAISSDGNTVIIGGFRDNDYTGAAWIFTRIGGGWTQQGAKLVGSDYIGYVYQGWSVSISGDGNTALIGGYGDNGTAGASWIFTRRDIYWTQLGAKLTGSGGTGNTMQGSSVSISANGTTAVAGGPGDGNTGAVWMFNRSPFRQVISHHNLNKPITGTQTTYDTSTIATNVLSYFISNVIVTIDTIRYVSLSDLEVLITHSSMNDINTYTDTLVYQVGGGGSDFIGTVLKDSAVTPISNGTPPFTGIFKPTKPLSQFLNHDPSGTWILNVYDRVTGHSGTLNAWTLTVDLAPAPIAVRNISQEVPKNFDLMQNYPNPFNPSTKIKFEISKSSFTNIKIYDILGREVSTLVNEQLKPGTYEANWNASNYPSGVYFYKLQTESFTETKKMVLVK